MNNNLKPHIHKELIISLISYSDIHNSEHKELLNSNNMSSDVVLLSESVATQICNIDEKNI